MAPGWKKPKSIAIKKKGDDKRVVKKLYEVLSNTDIVVAHNGSRFDIPKTNARLIYHNLPPIVGLKVFDTLREIKKVALLSSNRLDYLGKFLHIGRKIETHPNLWLEILGGNLKRLPEMTKYNRNDVVLLKDVYMKIRKYIPNHAQIFQTPTLSCRVCGSHSMIRQGTKMMRYGLVQLYSCKDCGSYSRDKLSTIKTKQRMAGVV